MYSLDYLIEKFEKAVFDLATGEGDARSRVRKAYDRICFMLIEARRKILQKEA